MHAVLEPAVIRGDPVLSMRLIANLVDNAARYNVPGGDIWISTGSTADGSRLTVANTGPVISEPDAARIFQPFERLSDRTSHDGFGLGLAIVASIAAVHGGTAAALPHAGGGLCVTVTIPASAAADVCGTEPVQQRARLAPSAAGQHPCATLFCPVFTHPLPTRLTDGTIPKRVKGRQRGCKETDRRWAR